MLDAVGGALDKATAIDAVLMDVQGVVDADVNAPGARACASL